MSKILRPIYINHQEKLIEIFSELLENIQTGARLLDTQVKISDYGHIDLVAIIQETKKGLVFFINPSGKEADFLASLQSLVCYQENEAFFQRLYAQQIDPDQSPLVFFLSPFFSPGLQKILLHYSKKFPIILVRYLCFLDGQEIKIYLERMADPFEERRSEPNYQDLAITDFDLPSANLGIPPLVKEQPLDLAKFRKESDLDLSNITDQELVNLLK